MPLTSPRGGRRNLELQRQPLAGSINSIGMSGSKSRAQTIRELIEENDWKNDLILFWMPAGFRYSVLSTSMHSTVWSSIMPRWDPFYSDERLPHLGILEVLLHDESHSIMGKSCLLTSVV